MKYVAFLRGINVGGNHLVKMSELKKVVEQSGFENALTYINSGNVIFETPEKDVVKITSTLEKTFENTFGFAIPCVVISHQQLRQVVDQAPNKWKKENNLRCYISFLKPSITPAEAMQEIEAKENIDFIEPGPGVVYMSTVLEGLTKSKIGKVIQKKIYQYMTMRNFNTVKKLLALMQET